MPPDGNTILHIFAGWLVEAVKLARNGYEDGTSVCLQTLIAIFLKRRNSKFDSYYLATFYSSLGDSLQKEGKILFACLKEAKHFFVWEYEGSRSLVPLFLYAVSNQLTKV